MRRLVRTTNDKAINRLAAWSVNIGTVAAVAAPLMACFAFFYADGQGIIDVGGATGLLTPLALAAYFTLSSVYLVRFETEIEAKDISTRAAGVATFWAGYVAAYATVIVSVFSSGSITADARQFLIWFSVGFIPILTTVTQALVPEAFWNINLRWQVKMLAGSAFMLFLHVSLAVAIALIILGTSYLAG